MQQVHRHIDEHFERYLSAVGDLIRQPSISATGEGVRECARLLADMMTSAGIRTEILETGGNPVVYGEIASGRTDGKTVLFYGHYDVQPPEPLELWESRPFEPAVRDGRLYARGIADNKGQLMAHILAVRAFRETGTDIPCSVKFVFEGEEESGSTSLASFVEQNRERLACDIALAVDGPMLSGDVLNVCLGCRGVLNFEIEVETARFDCHSGRGGDIIPNAGWELLRLLRTMKDEQGSILIEGFMDGVRTPTEKDMEIIAGLPFDRENLKNLYGVPSFGLDKNEYYTKLNLLPTLTINGITCGYQGKGSKTINPAKASVKMDARLVVDQNPLDVAEKIKGHVARHAPGARVTVHGFMHPSKTDGDLPVCRMVVAALEKVYTDKVALSLGLGGSLPSYVWTDILGVPALGIPYANQDSGGHAPNENFRLDLLQKAVHASAQILHDMK
ncbi:MAG: M20/M25/M40 family metallo-hydrolase [Aminivibrio sp.]|uniref:M20/M25/M40 family metallo-hydrolase n=1 Tax=Aminivibrio sp. TaxID=1872489 RepID=UPI002B216888|nr:M20/M25/M40 family metallo-hydrolase [Aminivibrio sp.]MEA4953845.1 M20/M25/M40 family metallo-hydrolase [Aminivibrio sp.]